CELAEQQEQEVVQILHLALGDVRDARATTRQDLDQMALLQNTESLTEGVGAHLELVGQLRCRQPGTGWQVATDDALTKMVGYLFAEDGCPDRWHTLLLAEPVLRRQVNNLSRSSSRHPITT